MARHNGLSTEDQDEIIKEIRFIVNDKFKFPFDIRRMTNQGGRELYICSKNKDFEKMKMFFCRDLDFDPESILGHSESRDDLAIQIDRLSQDLIDSIKSEYERITKGKHKDLEVGHHLLETNGKVIPLSINEIIPVSVEYKKIIPNPRFVRDIPKFEVQIPKTILKTEEMDTKEIKDESQKPVQKVYTGARRGRKTNAEREQLASLKTEASTPSPVISNEEPKVKKAPKTPKVQKEKLPKAPKVKKQQLDKHVKSDAEKLVAAYKFKVLSFLTSVLKFEDGIKPFPPALTADKRFCYFHDVSDEGGHYIVCRNKEIRAVAYEALRYALPSGDHFPFLSVIWVGEGIHYGCIRINFERMDLWRKEKSGINFCAPPAIGATMSETRKRLMRVSISSPLITPSTFFHQSHISYSRKETTKTMFLLTSMMNWPVSNLREDSFIIDLRSDSEKEKDELRIKEVQPVEPSIPSEQREVSPAPVVAPSTKEPIPFDQKVKALFKDDEEMMSEFENIFFDPEAYAQLSPEMISKIAGVLKEWYRKSNPQKYAEFLFKILGK